MASVSSPNEVYTHGHAAPVLRSHRWRTVENSAEYLIPHLTPGVRVLDVGCGPGNITADIGQRVAPGAVIGLDRAEDAIAAAARDYATENVEFRTGDVYALEYDDGAFDVVHAHQVLQHLADPVRALAEMKRVCTPGGVVAVRDAIYRNMTWWPESPGMTRWLSIYDQVARANRGEPDAGSRLVAWMHEAGFGAVDASASVWCFAAPEDRQWWGDTWAERISASPLAERAVELGAATRAELEECAADWRAWIAHPDACFYVVHGEAIGTA